MASGAGGRAASIAVNTGPRLAARLRRQAGGALPFHGAGLDRGRASSSTGIWSNEPSALDIGAHGAVQRVREGVRNGRFGRAGGAGARDARGGDLRGGVDARRHILREPDDRGHPPRRHARRHHNRRADSDSGGVLRRLVRGADGARRGLPYFHLGGPGVDLLQNLNEGGTETATDRAVFQPNATYTWTDDAQPGIVHTFATTGAILGTAGAAPSSPVKGAPAASQDVVGSDVVLGWGTLGAGGLAGKRVVVLQARPVPDQGHPGAEGRRLVHPAAEMLTLTAGRWTLSAGGRRSRPLWPEHVVRLPVSAASAPFVERLRARALTVPAWAA